MEENWEKFSQFLRFISESPHAPPLVALRFSYAVQSGLLPKHAQDHDLERQASEEKRDVLRLA